MKFSPKELLPEFDAFLAERGLEFEAVVIGAGALSVMGIVSRTTVDLDIMHPTIPDAIIEAASAFRVDSNAYCQRADDFDDLVKMAPTRDELLEAMVWLEQQDANPEWPDWVRNQLGKLGEALGYGI